MPQVHVLEARDRLFQCVVHVAVPSGNNSAGFAWKDVFLAAKRTGTTVMTAGTGPGQIGTAEQTQITSGDLMEFVIPVELESGGTTGAQITATITEVATARITETVARWQNELRRWGATKA